MTDLAGGFVQYAKEFTKNKTYEGKVTSTMIYGVQWDTTLKFFNDEAYLRDSKGKGWYSDNYSTGNPNHFTGIDVDANASNKVKNIYDMAGNVCEWTMEAYNTNSRVYRGGKYDYNGSMYPASNRSTGAPEYSVGYDLGFRLALYLPIL